MAFCGRLQVGARESFEFLPSRVKDALVALAVGGREAILPGFVWFWTYQVADQHVVPTINDSENNWSLLQRAGVISAVFLIQIPLYALKYRLVEGEEVGAVDSDAVGKSCGRLLQEAVPDGFADIVFPLTNAAGNLFIPVQSAAGKLGLVALGDCVGTGAANLSLRGLFNCCHPVERRRTPWPSVCSSALGSLGFTLAEGAATAVGCDPCSASLLVLAGVTVGQTAVVCCNMPPRAEIAAAVPAEAAGPAAAVSAHAMRPEHVAGRDVLAAASLYRRGSTRALSGVMHRHGGGIPVRRQPGMRRLRTDSEIDAVSAPVAAGRARQGRSSFGTWVCSWFNGSSQTTDGSADYVAASPDSE